MKRLKLSEKRQSCIDRISLFELELMEIELKKKVFLAQLEQELYYPPDDVIYKIDKSSVNQESGYNT